jgi:hypothetical protein
VQHDSHTNLNRHNQIGGNVVQFTLLALVGFVEESVKLPVLLNQFGEQLQRGTVAFQVVSVEFDKVTYLVEDIAEELYVFPRRAKRERERKR